MKTEFYLALMSGQRTFHRVFSEIQNSNFYRGVRQYHSYLQQHLNENLLTVRQDIVFTLIATAVMFSSIEEKQKSVENAIPEVRNIDDFEDPTAIQNHLISSLMTLSFRASEENDDPSLRMDTQEDFLEELLEIRASLMRSKSQFFEDQPWAMILFEEIEGQNGLLLKDFIVARYHHYLQTRDVYLADHSFDYISQEIRNIEAILDDLYNDIQPVVDQISNRVLERISYQVHRYRTHRQSLLNHDLILYQVEKDLEEVDREALEAYQGLIQEKEEIVTSSMASIAIATGAIVACWLSRKVAIPVATIFSATGFLDQASFKNALFNGAFFGLNSFSQYEMIHSPSLMEISFSMISSMAFATLCSKGKTQSSSLLAGMASLRQGEKIMSRLGIILHPRRLQNLLWEKITDINAGPAALASVIILASVQAYNQGIESLWNSSEFHFSFFFTAVVEFVLVFKSVKSGKAFFSDVHFKAMQDLSRTLFGISLSTQVIRSLREHGDLREIDWDRIFFEAGLFIPFISLTTTKLVINFMVNPFSGFLARSKYLSQNDKGHKELAIFLLMLAKNTFGNSLYLYSTNSLFNNDEEESENP